MNFYEFIRKDLRDLKPFQSARRLASDGKIWLNANESPWSLDVDQSQHYHRYPNPQDPELIQQLADLYQCQAEQLVITSGSDQSIDLLIRLCCRAEHDAILTCPPTFEMYQVYAAHQAAKVIKVPLIKEQGFAVDVEGIKKAWDPSVKIIFIVSPNNPTGNSITAQTLETLCESFMDKSLIVLDEAYVEFTQSASFVRKIADYPNLVVLRTLSKAIGLAGLRLGVTIANPELIRLLQIVLPPYPISQASIDIAKLALAKDQLKSIDERIKALVSARNHMVSRLESFVYVERVYPSETNFLLVQVQDSVSLMAYLLKQGIVPRHMNHHQALNNCIRFTIGTAEENQSLLTALENYHA